ncbi:uncharacterized protein LOC112081854 [Eutrema salsugineum]|uniref:uncharacterized protein LOC112081854 n=1 Tax=Eutrema salsugineum TaxID=72664 RepID=UPI000CED4CD3|nr:uncharacterized protein LOC112081854 [Eutrema salsugineum]
MMKIGGVEDDIKRLHKIDNNGNNYKVDILYILIYIYIYVMYSITSSVEVNSLVAIILTIETTNRFSDLSVD